MNAGALTLELPDAFELEHTGQLTIGVDGEQRALPMLAPEGKPAPVRHSSDHTEPAPSWTPATPEELAELAAEHVGELELEQRQELEEAIGRSWGDTRRRYEQQLERLELEEELAAPEPGDPDELEQLSSRSSRSSSRRRYSCAYCGRELEPDLRVYSRRTGSRYCPPSDPRGCNTPRAYAKQERARARARKEA